MLELALEADAAGKPIPSWTGVPYLTAEQVEGIESVEAFEPLAQQRMTPSVYSYVAGWAGTGATTRANRAAFGRYVLQPRVLTEVPAVDLSTTTTALRSGHWARIGTCAHCGTTITRILKQAS